MKLCWDRIWINGGGGVSCRALPCRLQLLLIHLNSLLTLLKDMAGSLKKISRMHLIYPCT